jgi:hypothetical protein
MDLSKYDQHRPPEYEYWMRLVFKDYWPGIEDYFDKMHFIYAGANTNYSFKTRPVDSVIMEITDAYDLGIRNFFFECLSEGVMIDDMSMLQSITDSVIHLPNIQLFYLSGDYQAEMSVKEHFKDTPINFQTIGVSHYDYSAKAHPTYDKPYIIGKRDKKFLCFNNVPRQHRIDLLNQIVNHDLLDKSYYSFDCNERELHNMVQEQKLSGIEKIQYRIPLVLNKTPERSNPVNIIEDDLKYFENSYFSLVTETMFYHPHNVYVANGKALHVPGTYPGTFVSEKTFKCIRMKHPFIIVGGQGYLAFLKSRGYRTFSPFIDETYDDIEDDRLRMQKIVNEVVRMCNLSDGELVEFTKFAKDIVEHNYRLLENISDFTTLGDLISRLNI